MDVKGSFVQFGKEELTSFGKRIIQGVFVCHSMIEQEQSYSLVTESPRYFEKVSYGGRVLMNASAMIAEREALRMGIEHLTV